MAAHRVRPLLLCLLTGPLALILVLVPLRSASGHTLSPAGRDPAAACSRAFEFLRQDVARNYAGFPDKVNASTANAYRRLVERTRSASAGAGSRQACLSVLRTWTAFFQDEHLMVDVHEPISVRDLPADQAPAGYARLDRRTAVLSLRDFGYRNIDAVQGIISTMGPVLEQTENLIIDLRGNSGGSDFAWQGLLPLIYTNPIRGVAAALYSTPDNIARLEAQAADPTLKPEVREWLLHEAAEMRAHPGEFVAQPDPVYRAERVLRYPRRVAVLVDRGCASSCEQLVLTLLQSRKVTVYGEPTAGAVDYTNLVATPVPGGEFDLVYPVSRSQRLPDERMDGRGIAPDVAVPASEAEPVNWVRERMADRGIAGLRGSDRSSACGRTSIVNEPDRGRRCGSARLETTDPGRSSPDFGCPSRERGRACDRSSTSEEACGCER